MKYFPYFYKITVDRVIDGDTVEATFDLGFCVSLKVTVRLAGYDAPETFRPKTEREKQAGLHCKQNLEELLSVMPALYCRSTKIDLYGRSTGIIYWQSNGEYLPLNDMMVFFIEENGYTKEKLRKTLDEELQELNTWGPSA